MILLKKSIKSCIKSLGNGKLPGPENIPLLAVGNKMLQRNKGDSWDRHEHVPLPKKGDLEYV